MVENGTPLSITGAVRDILVTEGVGTTYLRVCELLNSRGLGNCSKACYGQVRRSITEESMMDEASKQDADPAPPATEPAPDPGDSLLDFCKFAAMVQSIGGVRRAERFLKIMESHFGG